MNMDGKRRRHRKGRDDREKEKQRPITLAKREDTTFQRPDVSTGSIQPKILLKTKLNDETLEFGSSMGSTLISADGLLKTIIVTRSENVQSPSLAGNSSPNTTKEQLINIETSNNTKPIVETIPRMIRPATVISSTGVVNMNTRKLLSKTNTEFLVVGVIGTQGVGKTTILNILANEENDYDYYQRVLVDEDAIFPIKLKHNKCSTRSRTESTHMFCTNDRIILLDTPPVLCNSYKKDMTTNELDDLRNIITLLSICNLVIIVQDDYLNLNFIRLLRFAELMKPMLDTKPYLSDYMPNLLFVKNRAKRFDFMADAKAQYDRMLHAFFGDKHTQLRIYRGQTESGLIAQRPKLKKSATTTMGSATRQVNSFIMPEAKGPNSTTYHDSIDELAMQLRHIVYVTPRNNMCAPIFSGEFTEAVWFDLLIKVSQDKHNFFFKTYEDIQRSHFETIGNATNSNNNLSSYSLSRDSQESWRDRD